MPGLGKFGFYEVFKSVYSDLLGEVCYATASYTLSYAFTVQEKTYQWRTSLYLAASASAEFFADVLLAPMVCH